VDESISHHSAPFIKVFHSFNRQQQQQRSSIGSEQPRMIEMTMKSHKNPSKLGITKNKARF
jgi:hypothetical protein